MLFYRLSLSSAAYHSLLLHGFAGISYCQSLNLVSMTGGKWCCDMVFNNCTYVLGSKFWPKWSLPQGHSLCGSHTSMPASSQYLPVTQKGMAADKNWALQCVFHNPQRGKGTSMIIKHTLYWMRNAQSQVRPPVGLFCWVIGIYHYYITISNQHSLSNNLYLALC